MKSIRGLIDSAQRRISPLDAEVLLTHALGKSREYLIAHDDKKISLLRAWRYQLLVLRRRRGTPVAYLTGHKEFFGLDFFVNRHTLVPRPETETLVECVLELLASIGKRLIADSRWQKTIVIDVGTGSGCIPIAIAKTLEQKNIKTPRIVAVDSSKKSLAVARRNALRHGVDIEFLHGNLLQPFTERLSANCELIITANLPYLTPVQYAEEPTIRREPRSALIGGADGLEYYRELFKQIQYVIQNFPSKTVHCYCEIDPSQLSGMTALIKTFLPTATIKIKKDLGGSDRVVCLSTT